MKSNQRPNLRTRLMGVLVGMTLLGLLSSCVAPNASAPAASQPTATASAATTEMTATVMVTPTTVVTAAATLTATTPVTTGAAITTPNPVTPTTTVTATSVATTTGSTTDLTATEKYKDLPVGFTKEGYPYRGDPAAPITMYEYSDYQCPFCGRYFTTTEPAVDENYVRSGKLRVVFRDFPLVQLHPNAPAAANAANCVADQGISKFWAMHDQLFKTQGEWASLPDPKAYFAQLAQKAGADSASYTKCVESNVKTAFVQQGFAEAEKKGFSGTPSFEFVRTATNETFPLVGAQPFDQFATLVDTLVAGKKPEQPQADASQQGAQQGDQKIPVWATAEGLKPDPNRPGYTVAGDEYRGNPDAKVIVVEFSDFQCPFCRRHVQDTQPTLDKTFVDTNKIFWVFKNFPLSIHPQAPAAAVAAECAADQGKFWAMHDVLFKDAAPWSISDPNPVFTGLAKQLGLDTAKFTQCLSEQGDKSATQRVQSDMQDGQPFVQGTPTFIILFNGEGRIIPGALPVDRFTQALQQALDGTMK